MGLPFWPGAVVWATRDFTSMATLAPCLLVLVAHRHAWRDLLRPRAWPLALLLVLEVAVLLFSTASLLYLVVVALLLVAWRLGPLGAAVGVVSALVLAVEGVMVGRGQLSTFPGTPTEKLLFVQLFLTVSFHVSVPVAARLARASQLQAALGEALAATQDSEARFRLLTESMSDIVLRFDTQQRLRYISPSCRVLGYTPEEVLSRRIEDFAHPDDLARARSNVDALLRGVFDPAADRRYRVRKKDGSYRWYEGSPSPIRDGSGAVVGVVNLLRDVHAQQAAAEALAESEERYRVLADQMNDMVGCYGRDGNLTFVTGACRQLLGYDPEELVGRNVADLMPQDDADAARLALRRHLELGGNDPCRIECRMIRKDGSMVWVEGNPRAIRDETGAVVAWQDVVRDISGHKALEAKLRTARAEADFAATANAEFLIDMSHEFRGPLNSVLGFARLSHARPGLRDPIRTYIERMEEACRGLLGLVNDVLDFSRLEAKQVAFRPQPTPVGAFAAAALAQMEPQARAKDLELRLADRTPPDLVVSIDQDRLRQVLLNLLGNAVKFTHAGTVSLEVAYDGAERLHVTVRDTGPGIPTVRLDRLFERFSQVDEAGDRLYRGAGLGLAISKGIIDGLGGEIRASSEAGQGSAFSFWTPAPRVDMAAAAADLGDGAPPPRIRVLIAAADPDVRAWVVEGLSSLKAELLVAPDGEAAPGARPRGAGGRNPARPRPAQGHGRHDRPAAARPAGAECGDAYSGARRGGQRGPLRGGGGQGLPGPDRPDADAAGTDVGGRPRGGRRQRHHDDACPRAGRAAAAEVAEAPG
ncbi:PAS domain S-box protein [Phenylobacterium sp. J367]|nr:PAS domain S-box protein [Phenylobacterium sp. J367]